MASWIGEKLSSSVYLLAPKDSPRLSSCDEDWCRHESARLGEDLDHSQPTEWLNDLVRDYVHEKSVPSGRRISGDKPLNTGDVAAVERTLQLSSCALIVGLLYAERLKLEREDSSTWLSSDENYREQPEAPASREDTEENDDQETVPGCAQQGGISAADLFLVCVLTANKYLYDEGEPDSLWNSDMAFAGRRKTSRINELERTFLRMIKWHLHVSREEFAAFLRRVETTLAIRAVKRPGGSLHYQDADRLWNVIVEQSLQALLVLFGVTAAVAAFYGLLYVLIFSASALPVHLACMESNFSTSHSSQVFANFTAAMPSSSNVRTFNTNATSWENTLTTTADQVEASPSSPPELAAFNQCQSCRSPHHVDYAWLQTASLQSSSIIQSNIIPDSRLIPRLAL